VSKKIEQWSVCFLPEDCFLAPEIRPKYLQGIVDGKSQRSSAIVNRRGDLVITKSGAEYELGVPAAEYEAKYPGCRERLLDSLTEVE
jgi:hypothetical protein